MKVKVSLMFLCLLLAGAMVWAGGSPEPGGQENKEMTLRMGLITNEGHPVTQAAHRFAEIVNEKTDGNVTVQIIGGGSLGGEVEMHDMIASGTLDLGCFGSGIPSSYNPEFQILLMPYLWHDWKQMIAFSKSSHMEEMNRKYTEKSGVKAIASNWNQGERVTLSKRPINSLDDFKGLKIRVPQLPSWVDMWKMVGANPTPLAFTEVYTAMQQGVVDAVESPVYYMYSSSFYEQGKHLIRTNHVMYFNMVFMNNDLFEGLSEEYKKIFLDAAEIAGEYQNGLVISQQQSLEGQLEAEGVVFSNIDIEEVSTMMQPLYDKWEEQFGAEIRQNIETFKANH